MRQSVIWMPKGDRPRGFVPFEGPRPDRLWTLYQEIDEKSPPKLPYSPLHLTNGFIEDHVHDWHVRNDKLQYYSRVCDLSQGGVWLLLEWKE